MVCCRQAISLSPALSHQRPASSGSYRASCEGAARRLISLLKLLYWLVDCWTGYLLTICPGRHRSELIFFDRYFPDITVDPLRYRLPQSTQWFAQWLVKLAPCPDLCVLLNADWEVVQARKARGVAVGIAASAERISRAA